VNLTETELAQLISASRPKVSIVLSELEREGLIQRDHRRLILTWKAIAESNLPHAKPSLRTGS
jgi:DNA-binding IclR family transcriptional regulator